MQRQTLSGSLRNLSPVNRATFTRAALRHSERPTLLAVRYMPLDNSIGVDIIGVDRAPHLLPLPAEICADWQKENIVLTALELQMRQVGPWPLNAYALICRPERSSRSPEQSEGEGSRQSVLIDPGADPDILQEMLAGSTPIAILVTHTHSDHIGALAEMRARLHAPVMAHPGPHVDGIELEADRWLNDGDTVQVGEHTLRVYYCPGHTEDQICIAIGTTDCTDFTDFSLSV